MVGRRSFAAKYDGDRIVRFLKPHSILIRPTCLSTYYLAALADVQMNVGPITDTVFTLSVVFIVLTTLSVTFCATEIKAFE